MIITAGVTVLLNVIVATIIAYKFNKNEVHVIINKENTYRDWPIGN